MYSNLKCRFEWAQHSYVTLVCQQDKSLISFFNLCLKHDNDQFVPHILLSLPGAGLPVCRCPGSLQPVGPLSAVAAEREAAHTHSAQTSSCPGTYREHRESELTHHQ